jgi:hypothetical protein
MQREYIMAYDINKLRADLKRDLEKMEVKKRVTFHRAGSVHDDSPRTKVKRDRRQAKAALRRGEW